MSQDSENQSLPETLPLRREELFRSAFEQSPMSTQILSPDGLTLWVNRAWEELWGVTRAELGDYNILADPQLEAKGVMPFIKKAFAGERAEIPAIHYDVEKTLPGVDLGREPGRWVRGFTFPVKDETGAIREVVLMHEDITARRRAEETAERWANIFEHAQWGVVISSFDGRRLIMMNPAYARMHGYTVDELIDKPLSAVYAPEAREKLLQQISITRERGHLMFDSLHLRRDGTIFPVVVESTAIKGADGEVLYLAAHVQDVTERKRAEMELHKSREQIEIILQGVAESITAEDTAGRLIYANDAAARAIGYPSARELLDVPVTEMLRGYELLDENGAPFPPERLPGRVAINEGHSSMTTLCYRTKATGEERWSEVKATPVFDEDGQVQFAISIFQDITERRRDEDVQRFLAEASGVIASSLEYETTLASVARMSVPTLADWCAVDVLESDKTLKRLAVAHVDPAKVAWAHELHERYPPDMNASQGVAEVLRSGKSEIYPDIPDEMLVAAARDEEHLKIMREIGFTSAMVVPLVTQGRTLGAITFISAESGRRYDRDDLALAENLAERAAIAVDNARLYRSAQEANRLKDEFLATVSHELRTPLTSILGWATMLRANQFDAQTVNGALETIERNAKNQKQIIEDLLDVSRIITGKLRLEISPVELGPLIETAVAALRPAAEAKGVRLQKLLDTGLGPISGDPARLQQIIWNLLSNAIKFTPKGGRVSISLERINSHVEVAVSDTGQGVSAEFLPYVFDRFRQADSTTTRTHGGLGLGLAIVRHLVELHGGTVRAESHGVGQGATFRVALPLRPVYQAAAGDARAPTANFSSPLPFDCLEQLDGLRIMAVDDEADTRELLEAVLSQCGAEVLTVGSAREALEELERFRPDVLVSDIGMPEEDGYELIRQVRQLPAERGGSVLAIALTAYARAEDRLRVLREGYQMHVPKPVELAELVAVIASLVQRPGSP